MSQYYPQWWERYHKVYKSFDSYTKYSGKDAGKFSWDLKNTLADPDGYANMSADEILADLFDTYHGEAVYLGVKGYGDRNTNWDHKPTFQHQFFVDGDVRTFTVDADATYSLQNQLMEGYVYDIDVTANEVTDVELKDKGHANVVMGEVTAIGKDTITVDGKTLNTADSKTYEITSKAGGSSVKAASVKVGDSVKVMVNGDQAKTVYKAFVAEEYKAPVSGTPGEKTLKNFLSTALTPVGTSLYVYGGSWDWQDVNSSNQSMTIGLSQSWIDFFQSQDANYTYKYNADHSESYYPHEQWNQYYYAGIDCSAFVGWSVYNVMNTENSTVADSNGYVMSATKQAKNFAQTQGWGTWEQKAPFKPEDFKTGDIFSMNGHVWICLGKCDDGSLVILHSTPSDSINGQGGGGVQINGVGDSENCQAVKLAEKYMSQYYPQWWERYHKVYKSFEDYTDYDRDSNAGKFSWTLGGTISDPDGYADMKADAILADLFQDVRYIDASANNGGVISPEGRTNLTSGDSMTYSITPFSGYHISDVTVDGQSVGAVDSYTFDNVTDNHTIAVTFARDSGGNSGGGSDDSDPTYAIRASAGNGGSISPKGTVRVEKGDSKTYTITADKGYAIADVTVNGKSVGAVDSYTFKNVTSDQTIRATFALEGAVDQPGFSDVSKNDWFYDAVQDAVDMGLMAGVSADRFDPNGTVTRAMVAQILYAREGKPAVSGAAAISDVPANAWFHDAMQWAKAQGVIAGYPDGRMEPNAPVTREQLAVILHSYAQKKGMDVSKTADLAGYADAANMSVWAKDAMSWAVGSGLISGRSASTLAPAGSATRAECAVIFTQMFQQ